MGDVAWSCSRAYAAFNKGRWRVRTKTITGLVLLCAWSYALVSPSGAFADVNPANGHSYSLTPTPMNFFDARAFATGAGGYLASVNDQAEHDWLVTTFNVGTTPGPTDTLWVGYSDEIIEGTWVWDSGEAISYTNWGPGEPNDGGGLTNPAGEDYATLWWAHAGRWNDWPGDIYYPIGGDPNGIPLAFYGIVEVVPAPGALALLFGAAPFVLRRRRAIAEGLQWQP